MSHKVKAILQHVVDNVFWLFVAMMIILGSTLDTPFVNVGLTAR